MRISPHAAPFSAPARPELTGGRRIGVLLSHGFTGSSFSIRPWGESLAEHGYAVEVPRLPGHGSTWRELNLTGWEDWYGEITRSFDLLCRQVDAAVVGGLSMGGSLALRLAVDRPDQISGVVVVNPALGTLRKDRFTLPVLKHLVPAFPGIVNDTLKPDVDEHGYDRIPLKASASMLAGWKALRADLPLVTAPVLCFRSRVDHVVDDSSLAILTERVSSKELTVRMLEKSYHVATLDHDAPQIFDESAAFVARVTAP